MFGLGVLPTKGRSMPDYRLYFLNRYSGHIDGVEEFHSADDVEAICLIDQRTHDVPAELWRGGHKVARFEARSGQAATPPQARVRTSPPDPSPALH
jgi:hypothetical protein